MYRFGPSSVGPLQVPEHVVNQRNARPTNGGGSDLLCTRKKAVFGIALSAEEEEDLHASPEFTAAERWIAARTGGYGEIMPPPPKPNAANTR